MPFGPAPPPIHQAWPSPPPPPDIRWLNPVTDVSSAALIGNATVVNPVVFV